MVGHYSCTQQETYSYWWQTTLALIGTKAANSFEKPKKERTTTQIDLSCALVYYTLVLVMAPEQRVFTLLPNKEWFWARG